MPTIVPVSMPNAVALAANVTRAAGAFLRAGALTTLVVACSPTPSPPPADPGAPPPPQAEPGASPAPGKSSPQCKPTQTIGAQGRCFDSTDAACASLSCPRDRCEIQEMAPSIAQCR